jgi:hypothetical protein
MENVNVPTAAPLDDAELRDRAIKNLKKRRDFFAHLLVYLMVNGFLIVIWMVTSPAGFFWPIFPMVGWGIGVVMKVHVANRQRTAPLRVRLLSRS